MPVTLLLGAEGCSETKDEDWIRDATGPEVQVFLSNLGLDRAREYVVDRNGRPYWVKTVLDHAPAEILSHAQSVIRTVRLGG